MANEKFGDTALSTLRVGDRLQCDAGFTCIEPFGLRRVRRSARNFGLYLRCSEGQHYLDGQLDEAGHLVGVRLVSRNGLQSVEAIQAARQIAHARHRSVVIEDGVE